MRDLLREHASDRTLFLLGDSVSNLWFHALVCEATRVGLSVRKNESPSFKAAYARHRPDALGWTPDHFHVEETRSTVVKMGWGRPSEADTAAAFATGDTVVVNYGLHYDNETEYVADMSVFLSLLGDFGRLPGKVALFSETSAQSFAVTGAYVKGASSCAPTPPEVARDNLVYRQNLAVRRLAALHGVPVVPFYDATLPRWNLREEKYCEVAARRHAPEAECTDCTHLCYTPTFWAAQVDALHGAVGAHVAPAT
jgi:hypothetical protein